MTFIGANVPYHQQDTDAYCGPATAQMILAGLGGAVHKQLDLVSAGLSSISMNGGTSPPALQNVLNTLSTRHNFRACCDATPDAGQQTIVAGLLSGTTGVAAIVKGSSHWVVVTGADIAGELSNGPPYAINGFYVNDPEPQTAATLFAGEPTAGIKPPPPMDHQSRDNCGGGDVYGSANVYVPLSEWQRWYWKTPCAIGTQKGFITVSAGALVAAEAVEPAPDFVQAFVEEQASLDAIVPAVSAARPGTVNYDVDTSLEAKAKFAAWQGLLQHRIGKEGPLAQCLGDYELGDITCHTELDEPPLHSCQIRLMRDGHQIGTACVDAESGEFLGVQAPATIMPTPAEMDAMALAGLVGQAAALGDVLGPFDLENHLFTVHPTLVWRPCRQSMSRYYPFVQVNLAGTVLYVGLDGRVHRQLTSHEAD